VYGSEMMPLLVKGWRYLKMACTHLLSDLGKKKFGSWQAT
jgi:hypothetical protein